MRDDVEQDVRVVFNSRIEPPVASDASLPAVLTFVVFLGMERRMAEVLKQEDHLLVKRCLDVLGGLAVRAIEVTGVEAGEVILFDLG